VQETSSHNQALSACKRLAQQSAAHGWIDYGTSFSIGTIKARKLRGTRAGNWLAQQQAQALLNAPDPTILRGRRDRAVLALLLGTGIRRDELSRLDWSQIAQREGRPYIVDLLGKGNRLRTIAIPAWVMSIVLDWKNALDPNGRVVRSIRADGRIGTSLSASGIWNIVLQHSASAGLTCAPHDLRRSYAKLARKHGAPLDVIQKSLGHSSVSTTERYTNSGEQANAGDYFSL
jgi:site-specific recombinase XerD